MGLREEGIAITSIHDGPPPQDRETALRDFTRGVVSTLVVTADAVNGLNIPNVSHVINFDLPGDIEEYVHRIGRVGNFRRIGRVGGNFGRATSFFDEARDAGIAGELVDILADAGQLVPDFLTG